MPTVQRSSSGDAYHVARRLNEVVEESRRRFAACAAEFGLTAVTARFILRLHEPTSMRVLADHLHCDKSNVTGLASRLVDRGLVTSRPGSDRRVKNLELTARGRHLRAELEQRVAATSLAATRLTKKDQRAFIDLLDRLAGSEAKRE